MKKGKEKRINKGDNPGKINKKRKTKDLYFEKKRRGRRKSPSTNITKPNFNAKPGRRRFHSGFAKGGKGHSAAAVLHSV